MGERIEGDDDEAGEGEAEGVDEEVEEEAEEGNSEMRLWVIGCGLDASCMCIGISRHASGGPPKQF